MLAKRQLTAFIVTYPSNLSNIRRNLTSVLQGCVSPGAQSGLSVTASFSFATVRLFSGTRCARGIVSIQTMTPSSKASCLQHAV
jgi:hypothetical protein